MGLTRRREKGVGGEALRAGIIRFLKTLGHLQKQMRHETSTTFHQSLDFQFNFSFPFAHPWKYRLLGARAPRALPEARPYFFLATKRRALNISNNILKRGDGNRSGKYCSRDATRHVTFLASTPNRPEKTPEERGCHRYSRLKFY